MVKATNVKTDEVLEVPKYRDIEKCPKCDSRYIEPEYGNGLFFTCLWFEDGETQFRCYEMSNDWLKVKCHDCGYKFPAAPTTNGAPI